MILDLEIYQDAEVVPGDGRQILIASHSSVDVIWPGGAGKRNVAIASKDAADCLLPRKVQVAELHTFADYPIEIHGDHIKIEGIVRLATPDDKTESYGEWILRGIKQ